MNEFDEDDKANEDRAVRRIYIVIAIVLIGLLIGWLS